MLDNNHKEDFGRSPGAPVINPLVNPSITPLITRVQQRPSDFSNRGSVEPYSGACCCCCCCLHMIGAAAGGIPAIPVGWISAARKDSRPMHPRANMALALGLAGSILAMIVLTLFLMGMANVSWFFKDVGTGLLLAAAFVPSIVFVPIGPGMLLASWLLKLLDPTGSSETGDDQGFFCRNCLYDLRGTPDSPTCPECGAPVVRIMRRPGFNYGFGIGWRVTWMSILFSTIGTGVGWLVMVIIGLIMQSI